MPFAWVHAGRLAVDAVRHYDSYGSYEQAQESLAMLKLLAQSRRSIEAGKHEPPKKALTDLANRTKKLS